MCDCEGAHTDACRMRSYRARRSRALALRRQAADVPAQRTWAALTAGLDGAGLALRVARRIVLLDATQGKALLAGLIELDHSHGGELHVASSPRRAYPARGERCACGRCDGAPRPAAQSRYASRACSAVAARDRRLARAASLRALGAAPGGTLAPLLQVLVALHEPAELRLAGRLVLLNEAELRRLLDAADRQNR